MILTLGNMIRIPLDDLAKWILKDFEAKGTYNPDKQQFEARCYYTPTGKSFVEIILTDKDKPTSKIIKPASNSGGLITLQ